ncbi:MAG: tRNA-dihydrouridine synthase, partial [Hyphomicrobiaceae bacterium]|nr:tRNA-dihydrouridine synthase [Hyphomicrobiaceae bacterium]
LLAQVAHRLFGHEDAPLSRRQIVERMIPHIEEELAHGLRLNQLTRHMMGLYAGEPGARLWRRELGEKARLEGARVELVTEAMEMVEAIRERALCKS